MKRSLTALFVLLSLHPGLIYAQSLSSSDCNQIFDQRKSELMLQIEKLEEKEQAIAALQNAGNSLQGQKSKQLNQKINQINKALSDTTKKEQNIKAMLAENKRILDAIQKAKDDKIVQSYTKMKPAAAAGILSEMNASSAASILFNLDPKKMAEILAKMDAKKAAIAVERLRKGPPFR